MKTKEQRISEMIGKTYGFIETGKIEIIFSGKIGTVKVMLRNRRQVLEVLKRFYCDEFGIMDWVDTVIINNPYEGWVKVNGAWKWRKKIIEIKITKKKVQTQKAKKTTKKENMVEKLELKTEDGIKLKKIEIEGRDDIYKIVRSKKELKEVKEKLKKDFDKWIEIPGIPGIKVNWTKRVMVDDFINTKKFKSKWGMLIYINKLRRTKEQEKQQMLTFDVQRFARSETVAEMTIAQLEELVNKMKVARDKRSCSSSVKITIDNEGTITFNQRSAYQECIGRFYTYMKK